MFSFRRWVVSLAESKGGGEKKYKQHKDLMAISNGDGRTQGAAPWALAWTVCFVQIIEIEEDLTAIPMFSPFNIAHI